MPASPSPDDRAGQSQTPRVMLGLASGGVTNPSSVPSSYSLRPEAHAKAGQVTIGDGEEDHKDDEPGVMREHDRQVVTGVHVAQHEKRDKYDTEGHHHWQEAAVLPGLGEKHRSLSSEKWPFPIPWHAGRGYTEAVLATPGLQRSHRDGKVAERLSLLQQISASPPALVRGSY